MARFFDRIMAKGTQVSMADLLEAELRLGARDRASAEITRDHFADGAFMEVARTTKPGGTGLKREFLAQAHVVAADEVVRYLAHIRMGPEDLGAMLSTISIVPTRELAVIEAQNLHGWYSAFAWLVERTEDPDSEGWIVTADLILEWAKGQPVGPIAQIEWKLGPDGRYVPEDNVGRLPATMVRFPDDPARPGVMPAFAEHLLFYSYEATIALAMTLGLMQCKNVNEIENAPQPRLSNVNRQKYGRALANYSSLDIRRVTSALDRDGKIEQDGLSKALHRCRGHFKTYRADAPLFGKLAGQFWWQEQEREHTQAELEVSLREDRSEEPAGIGRQYQPAAISISPPKAAAIVRGSDPDQAGRGRAAHDELQNTLARLALDAGRRPLSPCPNDPQFDIAWHDGNTLIVVEVKSTTESNEVHQVRLAIGQIMEYTGILSAVHSQVRAVIAVERPISRSSLITACEQAGVTIVWPGHFVDIFAADSVSERPALRSAPV